MRTIAATRAVLGVFLVFGLFNTHAARAQETERELYRLDRALPRRTDPDAASRASRATRVWRVRPILITGDEQRLRVPLPDGRIVHVRRTATGVLDSGGRLWAGESSAETSARVRLVARHGVVVGSLEVGGQMFALGLDAGNEPVLEEVEPGQPCAGGRVPSALLTSSEPGGGSSALVVPPGQPTVDLLVAYTANARVAAGGDIAIRGTIDLAVAATNEALANSQVQARVRLVDTREVAYQESQSLSLDLDRVTERADGYLDEVHAWREASGADMVSLMVERNVDGLEGLAWLMQQPATTFAPLAFSVVMRRSAGTLTLAHEIGHNLGLAHDRTNAGGGAVYPYAFGYRDPPFFRDLMSYPCAGTPCPRVPFFSNPDVLYNGRPMGRAGFEDGARALRQTLPIAAAFRSGSGPLITSVAPATVSTLGGIRVTLQGTRMAAVTRVDVGGAPATALVLTAADSLSIVLPRHPKGPADITVEDDEGRRATLPAALDYVGSVLDIDGDALDDDWERAMGLDATIGTGQAGPDGDPDGDGLSNLRERLEHGHPMGLHQRYFAEGAAGSFFATRLALLNASAVGVGAVVRYLRGDGLVRSQWLDVPAHTRRTLLADPALSGNEFSVVVESDAPLVVDRTMFWGAAASGAHAETARLAPATRWFLAEGATIGGFNLFYLLQNPGTQPAQVRIRYLRAAGMPLEKIHVLPPLSRTTIWVNQEDFAGMGRALAAAEVSADIEVLNGPAIIVERSMYLNLPGQPFGAGHESAGVTAPATTWFLAEGATGPYFDLFVLIANPAAVAADVEVVYLLPDGATVTRSHTVPAASRYTIWVDQEDAQLANTAVATTIRAVNGIAIVVERAMWWPGSSVTWHEAHGTAASVKTATRWAVAEGEVGGPLDVETFILIANSSSTPGTLRVALLFEDGSRATRTFEVLARSRFNVDARAMFPEAAGRRFGAVVESIGPAPVDLVVEWAQYWDALGQRWAAGTNAMATSLP